MDGILQFFRDVDVSEERGSMIVATLLFMFVFLGIASFGIDASRYFYKSKNIQSIADNAALAGGRVFNRYSSEAPDDDVIRQAALNHIENHLGEDYPSSYPGESDGIIIEEVNPPGESATCTDGFAINDGNIVLNQPAQVESEVLGSAITYSGSDVPVTAQTQVTHEDGSSETIEPWGDYDDPHSGNLNVSGGISSVSLPPQDAGSTITTRAQSHLHGSTFIEAEQGDYQTRTLSNGDEVPDISGFGDQDDMNSFVQEFVDDEGKVDLPQNEAIVFYELGSNSESSDAFDLQDLVLRMTVNPNPGSGGNDSVENVSSSGSQSPPCNPFPDGTYRIGVIVQGKIQYHLWPDWFKETDSHRRIVRTAIAEVVPQPVHRNFPDPDCGVYTGGTTWVTGKNLNASSTNFCSNSGIEADQSNGGKMGDLYVPEGAGEINPPHGEHGETRRLPEEQPIPTFTNNNPSDFSVDLNNFDSWSDLGSCSTGGKGKGGGGGGESKALRTQDGDDVTWGSGGSRVCVSKDGSGNYVVNDGGDLIQEYGGDPVSIYADGAVTFSGNNNGIKGGLYAEGDVVVPGNNYDFFGDPSVQGGLSLWSEEDVLIEKNSVTIEGITGSGGDYTFEGSGGGNGPVVEGVLANQGDFEMDSNSNNARISHDTSKYDPSSLSGDWSGSPQEELEKPLYSNVKVRLIR